MKQKFSLRAIQTHHDTCVDTKSDVTFVPDPIFQLLVPKSVLGIPNEILEQRNTWEDGTAYDEKAHELATLFINNFKKYRDYGDFESAGPLL